jgi:hypothetical protein
VKTLTRAPESRRLARLPRRLSDICQRKRPLVNIR